MNFKNGHVLHHINSRSPPLDPASMLDVVVAGDGLGLGSGDEYVRR